MPVVELTDREEEIVRLLCQGYSTREILATLFINNNTLKTHIMHAMAKAGVHSRLDLPGWYSNRYLPSRGLRSLRPHMATCVRTLAERLRGEYEPGALSAVYETLVLGSQMDGCVNEILDVCRPILEEQFGLGFAVLFYSHLMMWGILRIQGGNFYILQAGDLASAREKMWGRSMEHERAAMLRMLELRQRGLSALHSETCQAFVQFGA